MLNHMTMTSVCIKGQSDLWIWQVLLCDIFLSRPQGCCHFQERRKEGGGYTQKNDSSQAEKVEELLRGRGVRNKEGRVGMKARNS